VFAAGLVTYSASRPNLRSSASFICRSRSRSSSMVSLSLNSIDIRHLSDSLAVFERPANFHRYLSYSGPLAKSPQIQAGRNYSCTKFSFLVQSEYFSGYTKCRREKETRLRLLQPDNRYDGSPCLSAKSKSVFRPRSVSVTALSDLTPPQRNFPDSTVL
jgi:hypothetical protein